MDQIERTCRVFTWSSVEDEREAIELSSSALASITEEGGAGEPEMRLGSYAYDSSELRTLKCDPPEFAPQEQPPRDASEADLDDVTKRMPSAVLPSRSSLACAKVLRFPLLRPLPPIRPLPRRSSSRLRREPVALRALPPIRPLPPKQHLPLQDEALRPSVLPVTRSVEPPSACIWRHPFVARAAFYGALVGAGLFLVSFMVRLATRPAASAPHGHALIVTVAGPSGDAVPEVTVLADGVARCSAAPCRIELDEGTHLVSVAAPGFVTTAPRAVKMGETRDLALHVQLWPRVEPRASAATTFESSPPLEPTALAGRTVLEPPVPASRPTPKPMVTPAPQSATLNLNAIPLAHVVLDGRPLGSTPKIGVSVAAGAHRVLFLTPDGERREQSVDVDAGAVRTVAVRF